MVKVKFWMVLMFLCAVVLGYHMLRPRPFLDKDAIVGGISVSITEMDEDGIVREESVDLNLGDTRLVSVEHLLKSVRCRKGLGNTEPGELTAADRDYEISVYGEHGEILEEYRIRKSGALWRVKEGKLQWMQMGIPDSRDDIEALCQELDQILGYLDILTLRVGEQTIVPYWCQEWAKQYMDGGWVHGDFVRAADQLPELVEKIPSVRIDGAGGKEWSSQVRLQLPEHETFSYIHIYDEDYLQVAGWLTEDQFRDYLARMPHKTCYALICVSGESGFVEAEGEYNTYGGMYVVRVAQSRED